MTTQKLIKDVDNIPMNKIIWTFHIVRETRIAVWTLNARSLLDELTQLLSESTFLINQLKVEMPSCLIPVIVMRN